VVGTSLVMLALFGSATMIFTSVYTQAEAIVDELPIATYKLNSALRRASTGELGTLDKLRSAAETLKNAANSSGNADTKVLAESPAAVGLPEFNLNEWLWAGSLSAAAFAGKMTMVLFLVFFALLSGDTFKRKLVKLTGPSLS